MGDDDHMHQGTCVLVSFVGGCRCQGGGKNMLCLECHMEYLTLVYAEKNLTATVSEGGGQVQAIF